MKFSTEAKVGAFTLAGLIVFASSIMFLDGITLFKPDGMNVTGKFKSVTGLKTGFPVRYSGVDVGKVEKISVTPEGVTVTMAIDGDTKIPKDSRFTIEGDGLLGEKFIQIKPGQDKSFLAAGDSVDGDGDSGVDKALGSAGDMMNEANKMLKSMNAIIGDEKTQQSLKGALQSTDGIAKNMEALTAQMNSMMAQNTGRINELAANMVIITRNMSSLTAQMDASIKRLDGDGHTSDNMRAIAANMKEVTSSMNRMAQSLEGVVTDPKTAADVKETLHNTAHLTSVLSTLTGGGDSSALRVESNLEMLYHTDAHKYSHNAGFRFYTDSMIAELGAFHIGRGTELEFNFGKRKGNVAVRGGIFDGDVGLGLDYGVERPYRISVAAMNPDDVRYRIRGEIQLLKDTYFVGQFIRPFDSTHGGDYFGLNHKF